ncbi:MAG: protein kinase domain-containing protein, partial [Planctomycetaceae bacterium]
MPSAGRYRILRALEEGGMGEVFLALDTDLSREVIVKKPKKEFADKEIHRRRFLREIRVGALLEHPGIAPVYDIGEDEDGALFGVMRYLPEGTLHRLVRDYHRDHPTAIDEVAFRGLLGHFATACRAIAYAHSREVYHLDIKPRNVVTGRFGETQVIDWGLAWTKGDGIRQRVGDGSAALSGGASDAPRGSGSGGDPSAPRGFHGTRAYASPEQWDEDWETIGPATDVYGLGTTLHEILAGAAPFDTRTPIPREDVLGGHRHSLPKAWMPRALVAIAARAMAPAPAGRYRSASALADDIDRFLADEPVEAFPDPWQTRVWRWVKRYRTPVAAAVALLLTSAVALGVGYAAVARQRDVALRNLETARGVIRNFCIRIGDDFWVSVPQADGQRMAMLEEAVRHYRQLLADHPGDPVIGQDSAEALRRLANLLRLTGRAEDALPLFEEALAGLAGLPDDAAVWRDRLETRSDRSYALSAFADAREVLAYQRETFALAEAYRARFPGSSFAPLVLARTCADLARTTNASGRPEEAAELFDRALATYHELLRGPDTGTAILRMAIPAAVDAAAFHRAFDRQEAAVAAAAAAMAWAARLVALDAGDPNHRLLEALAIRETLLTDPRPEPGSIDAAIGSLETIAAEHPEIPSLRFVLAETLLHFAAA